MSEFYPSKSDYESDSDDDLTRYRSACDQLTDITLTAVSEKMEMYKYIVSQLITRNCEGGCGTVFYFKYQHHDWHQYNNDDLICSYPPNRDMAEDEDRVICLSCVDKLWCLEKRLGSELRGEMGSENEKDGDDFYPDSRYCSRCKIGTSNLVKTKLDLCYECEPYRQEVVAQLNRDLDDYHRSNN